MIFKWISDFHFDCKFRFSNRLQVPKFKSISKTDFQTDYRKVIIMNDIQIELKFDTYEFRRVTTMGNKTVAYTSKDWVGKDVIIIPVPLNITDRWVEKQYDEKSKCYKLRLQSDTIIRKVVGELRNVGRLYIPKEFIGMDVLIIETPKIPNLY